MAEELTTTFVFSDIEHSTRLAQQLREDYPEALERHRQVIRASIAGYHGREIDTAGDGFFMTFPSPEAAMEATAEMQQQFHKVKWATDIELKVRMGIHTGAALATDTGFTGVEVHLASRISSAAYGGQVLVSQAARDAMQKELADGISLVALGDYQLKDFAQMVGLYRLDIPGVKPISHPRITPDDKRIAVLPFSIHSKKSRTGIPG